ncbi:hypothetical protein TrLO_g7348 [Triparma laevis f. longispina]|uniref:subtilisin n=1 Tax=Triparma laevis f. longispina TaxID=1714387 RepID=A0A9W7FLQ9_9STRA|nr:hypothetical protein TrLO_g7348 [Triparma laevis f. longispina]
MKLSLALIAGAVPTVLASDRALSSYCSGAVRDESTVIPYADYVKFQLPQATEYCVQSAKRTDFDGETSSTSTITYPNGFNQTMCKGTWTTHPDFQSDSSKSTEEKYLCEVASANLPDTKKSYLALLAENVVPGESFKDRVHSIVSGLDVSNFAPTTGGFLSFLSLTSSEYDSLVALDDTFTAIQPVLDSLKVTPIVDAAPDCSPIRITAAAEVDTSIFKADLDTFLSSNTYGSCDDAVSTTISTFSTFSNEIIVNGIQTSSTFSAAVVNNPTTGPKTFQIEADLPIHMYNEEAAWITQSGNRTDDHTPFWNHGITGSGITVGVADSGLDHQSCYFYDSSKPVSFSTDPDLNVPIWQDTRHRKVVQYVGYAGNNEGEDGGHGTHVVGSVLGNRVDDVHDGMAYDAKVAFYDIGVANAQYLNVPGNLATQMFPYAKRVNALLHSNSWGSESNSMTGDARQVDQYSWDNQDFLVLVAAGNSGGDGSSQFPGSLGAPATAKNCVSVGATSNGDNDNDLAYFSSRGPAFDNRIKPDVVAPGYFISSANSKTNPTDNHCSSVGMAGTSMATPVTAGIAALAQEYFEKGWYPSGTKKNGDGFKPMGALLKAVLINGGQRLTTSMANYQGSNWPNFDQGHGIIELDATLNFKDAFKEQGLFVRGDFADMPKFASSSDPAVTQKFTSTGTSCMPDGQTKEFRATLVWHDYPSSTSTSKSLVNDLDIKVVGSDGNVYYPNGGSGRDSVNNAESVVFTPTDGVEYTVEISANTVAQGPQPYSYVISGCFASPDRPADDNDGGGGIFGGAGIDSDLLMYIGGGLGGLLLLVGLILGTMKLLAGRTPRQPKYKVKRASAYGGQRKSSNSSRRSSGFAAATGFTGQGFSGAQNKSNAHRPAGGSIPLNTRRASGNKGSSKTKFHGKVQSQFNGKKWDGMV